MTARQSSSSVFDGVCRFLCGGTTAAMLAALFLSSSALGQGAKSRKGSEHETLSGTVTHVEKKGKTVTLSIETEDGRTIPVLVSPRLKLSITGPGDLSLIQPRGIVSSEKIVKSNNELFGHEFIRYVGVGNAPFPGLKQKQGAADWYQICGVVASIDDKSVTLNLGPAGGMKKVSFEEGMELEVTVNANDPDLVAVGSKVELEGITRGTRFTPSKLTVTLEKPLTADDLQAAGNDKKSSKAKASSARGGKKAGKSKTGEPADASADTPADPFGVLEKKEGKEGDEAGSKSDEKSPPEEKGSEEKGSEKKPDR
jgi:hypothetical protein